MANEKRLLLGGLLLGTLLRIAHTASSIGSPDAVLWFRNMELLNQAGIRAAYLWTPGLNHPPLALALAQGAYKLGARMGLNFPDSFRILTILADLATALLLLRIAKSQAALIFFLSPAAIFISGFHCNSDPIMVMFVVAAIVALLEGWPLAAGVLIACAASIKVIALVALPLLLFTLRGRAVVRFLLGGALTAIVVFGPAFLVSGPVLLRNVFLYTGSKTAWGLPFLAQQLGLRGVGAW
ncbi:MAG: mannosyltransferase family protein, partial [Thermoanaerobaculia bacterium]